MSADAGGNAKDQSNVPVPDPTDLTTENLLREITHLRELLESQHHRLREDLDTYTKNHNDIHSYLKESTDRRFAEVARHASEADQRYQQRYEAQSDAIGAAFVAQQEATRTALAAADQAVTTALESADKAVLKSEALNEKRFESFSENIAITHRLSDLVHELLERVIAVDRITDAKFVTFRTLIDSQAEKVALALASADKAVSKSETLNEKRFELLGQHSDELSAVSDRMEHLTEAIQGLDRLTDAKFVTFRTLVDSEAEKVALALAASDKAVSKAEAANEKRFESFNEFRAQLNDQAGTFMTQAEARAIIDALSARMDESVKNTTGQIADLKSYRDTARGGQEGNKQLVAYIFGSIAAIGGLIGIGLAIFANAMN